jgi:CubicO group peptidase (beta-lactamase class C family)
MESISPENVGFSSERLKRIGPMMQAYVDRKELPGLITLIARKGKIVHFGKFGLMDIETNKPMQADTIFRIYSMTKPITNVAAMMLYEEGRFQLDDPLSKFIPAFKDVKVLGKSSGADIELVDLEREITIRDLMTHTSGLTYDFLGDSPVDALYQENDIFDRGKTLQENIHRCAGLPRRSDCWYHIRCFFQRAHICPLGYDRYRFLRPKEYARTFGDFVLPDRIWGVGNP